MFRIVLTGLLCLFLSGCTAHTTATTQEGASTISSMRVLWRVGRVEQACTDGASCGGSFAPGTPLDITASSITFGDRSCTGVRFERSSASLADFLGPECATPSGLSPTAVTVFRSDCDIPGFAEYARLPDGRLLLRQGRCLVLLPPVRHY